MVFRYTYTHLQYTNIYITHIDIPIYNPAEPQPSALFMLSAALTMLMEILKRMWRKMQEYVWFSVQIRVYSKYTSESGGQSFEEYVDKVAKVSIHSLPYK